VTRNTLFEDYTGPRLTPQAQMERLKRVMEHELTPIQREVMTAFYFENKTMAQISRERNVSRSTICRTLHRAENRCRRCLQY
jgi:RNA polymerase sigma factor (sigma-70 family)